MGIPTEGIAVTVEGDLDLQGTLGMSKDVPVGFENIRVRFDLKAPGATAEQLSALREKTERYCVVYQTIRHGTEVVQLLGALHVEKTDVRVEGIPNCDWVLIDAGDVIVHVFRPEVRTFYNLENMWAPGQSPRRQAN